MRRTTREEEHARARAGRTEVTHGRRGWIDVVRLGLSLAHHEGAHSAGRARGAHGARQATRVVLDPGVARAAIRKGERLVSALYFLVPYWALLIAIALRVKRRDRRRRDELQRRA